MVNGCRSEHHAVMVGGLGAVGPSLPPFIPVVTARQIAHQTLRELLPHMECKVSLPKYNH